MTIRRAEQGEHDAIYRHMKRDFPANELPPAFAVKGNLKSGVYEGVFFQNETEEDVGYAVVTAPEGSAYGLVNFFAIFPEVRSMGYGGRAISALADHCGRVLVLEVDSPDAAKEESDRLVCERRIRFYERAGFSIIPTKRAKIFGVHMLIMMNTSAPVHDVREIMHEMYLPAFDSKRWLRFIDVRDAKEL